MRDIWIPICGSAELADGGRGIRFPLTVGGEDGVGFVVRHRGEVRGYLNQCAHVPIELDWDQGDFFDSTGSYLICSTHGALYVPETGRCAGGPCRGGRLRQVTIKEDSGQVLWQPDDYLQPARA